MQFLINDTKFIGNLDFNEKNRYKIKSEKSSNIKNEKIDYICYSKKSDEIFKGDDYIIPSSANIITKLGINDHGGDLKGCWWEQDSLFIKSGDKFKAKLCVLPIKNFSGEDPRRFLRLQKNVEHSYPWPQLIIENVRSKTLKIEKQEDAWEIELPLLRKGEELPKTVYT